MTTGTPEQLMRIDIKAEMEHWFRDDSWSEDPEFVLIMGTGVSGKTRVRHAQYAQGFVNVDAADIFRRIEGDQILDFPGDHRPALDLIGAMIASRAIRERRNIVTEVHHIGFEFSVALIEAMKGVGYQVKVVVLECEWKEAQRRNLARGPHNISAYDTDEFNVRWLVAAARRGN